MNGARGSGPLRSCPFATLVGCILWLLNTGPALAAAATNPPAYYRLSQLDDMLARAKKEDKPIAWIASFPGSMVPHKNPLARGSHAATYYAYLMLYRDAIIVWSDSDSENHTEPEIVDRELHSPNAHYTAPGVIVLTPDLKTVMGKVFYVAEPQARQATFSALLKRVRDKKNWGGGNEQKPPS